MGINIGGKLGTYTACIGVGKSYRRQGFRQLLQFAADNRETNLSCALF